MLDVVFHYLNNYCDITNSKVFIIFYEVDSKSGLCKPISEVYFINELNTYEILNSINWSESAFDYKNNDIIIIIIFK
jgi:hypothetical protein